MPVLFGEKQFFFVLVFCFFCCPFADAAADSASKFLFSTVHRASKNLLSANESASCAACRRLT